VEIKGLAAIHELLVVGDGETAANLRNFIGFFKEEST
jgi:hypothetical protein